MKLRPAIILSSWRPKPSIQRHLEAEGFLCYRSRPTRSNLQAKLHRARNDERCNGHIAVMGGSGRPWA